MIQTDFLKNYYPPYLWDNPARRKYIIKESARCGIKNQAELKQAFNDLLQRIDLSHKAKDFEHLVFQERSIRRIMLFNDFVNDL